MKSLKIIVIPPWLFFQLHQQFQIRGQGIFFSLLLGFPDFIYTDQTMQQLKNAGGLRLIRDKAAIDSIIAYDAAVRDILIEETVNSQYFDQLTNLTNNQFSYRKNK
jgi:hypothetical protein